MSSSAMMTYCCVSSRLAGAIWRLTCVVSHDINLIKNFAVANKHSVSTTAGIDESLATSDHRERDIFIEKFNCVGAYIKLSNTYTAEIYL